MGEQPAGVLEEERAGGAFPSYQALVLERGHTLFEAVGGEATVEPTRTTAVATTLYDLASLTKPLVTALLALRLAEEGMLPLEVPVSRWMEELLEPPKDRITVLDLLLHRAGFAAWAPLYLEVKAPILQRYAQAVARRPLESPPGTRVVYSDLGFLVLGALLERVTGHGFAALAGRHVLHPLGIPDLLFLPRGADVARAAATERGNEHERRKAGIADAGDGRFRPGRVLCGEVHDGNAAALGGVAPHAGLFGTSRAVAAVAGEYLRGGTLLGMALKGLAGADLTPGTASHRTAAFELAANPGSAAQGALDAEAFGHTGFTGTSVWIEPRRERIYVLLTNRVHPQVRDLNMNAVRRRFHAAAAGLPSPARSEG